MKVVIFHAIGSHAGDHWQQWLHDQLKAKDFEVVMPQLSNADHPDRAQWLQEAKQAIGDSNPEELILVGHSLGVTTALDYLEQTDKEVNALVSVAGFYADYGSELNSYFLRAKAVDVEKVRHNLTNGYVIFSDNDPYVDQKALQELADALLVDPIIIPGGGHFNTEAGYTEFPKLLELILEIADAPGLDLSDFGG